jgi:hypothetical protein
LFFSADFFWTRAFWQGLVAIWSFKILIRSFVLRRAARGPLLAHRDDMLRRSGCPLNRGKPTGGRPIGRPQLNLSDEQILEVVQVINAVTGCKV